MSLLKQVGDLFLESSSDEEEEEDGEEERKTTTTKKNNEKKKKKKDESSPTIENKDEEEDDDDDELLIAAQNAFNFTKDYTKKAMEFSKSTLQKTREEVAISERVEGRFQRVEGGNKRGFYESDGIGRRRGGFR